MITQPDDYFARGCGRCARFDTPDCATRTWAGGLAALRRICLGEGLEETAKWGQPCYMHAGRNIVIIGALRGGFRLGFFNAALMRDPDGIMQRQGPNTRNPDVIKFDSAERVAALEPMIRACLQEAMAHARAGTLPPRDESERDLPEELVEALDADPELAEAFHALSRGRRNSHVIALASARTSATRHARIARLRGKILAGKGATER